MNIVYDDKVAKEVSKRSQIDLNINRTEKTEKTEIKGIIKHRLKERWQKQWEEEWRG